MKIAAIMFLLAAPANADVVLAARTLRPQTIITAADLVARPGTMIGVASDPAPLIGQETRVALYAGRPVRPSDVGPPAVIERNQIVPLVFAQGGLRIQADGRALGRAGVGDRLRIMNLASRTTVWGIAQSDGSVIVN